MARKKSSKALFEVIGGDARKADKQLGVPGWFGQAGPAAAEAPPGPEPPKPGDATVQAPPKPPKPVAMTERQPAFYTSGDKMTISLSTISALLILLGLIALLAAAFGLGRWSVRAARAGEGGAAQGAQVAGLEDAPPGVVPVPRPVPGQPPGASVDAIIPDDADRPSGYYYLVVQGGIDSRKEAEHIKRFLYSKGVDATIHRMGVQGTYIVKDLRGFKDPDSPEVRDYVDNTVLPLGQAYMKDGGGNRDFGQRRDAPPWMIYEK